MAEVTRKSVMAVKKEVTVGTPLMPTSGADFVALQDDVSMKPSFDKIDNNELASSVGLKPAILGIENPEFSFSHYIRHSGVEATDPSFMEFMESGFGLKVAASAEFDTVAGSTAGSASVAAVVNVDVGEGASFQKGKALLIKDGTNGYSIRNVQSVASDALTLGFNLASAPGTGVNLGRAILLKPDDAPPSLTVTLYTGNGGALQVMAGGRVSQLEIKAEAGQPLSGSFTVQGTSYYFDPIEITATDTKLDFLDNATTRVATIAAKLYKDPYDLADAIQTAMNSLGSSNTFTCSYSKSTGKFTITSNGTTLTLKWNTGANAANTVGDKIGFSTAADSSAALTYTSANAQVWAAPYTPTPDSNIDPVIVKSHEVMIGDFSDYGCAGVQSFDLTLSNDLTDVKDVCEDSGIKEKILSKRTVEAKVVLNLTRHDADKFHRFHQGSDVRFAYNGGLKSGGNWIAGRSFNTYIPEAKITEYEVTDTDGIVTIEMTIQAYVKTDGQGEVFFNFL